MRNILKRAIDYIFDKSLYISGFLVIVLSIIDISNLNDWTIKLIGVEKFEIGNLIYYLTVILAIFFGIVSTQNAKEIEKLENEVKLKGDKIIDLESKLTDVVNETNDLFNSYLRLLVKNLAFTHTERISVYKSFNNKFKLIGRSSVNPIFMEVGRPEYPIDEGFISKGWREGEFFIDNLPDPNQRNGQVYHSKINQISSIPKAVIDNMKMKSRTYFIYRINGYDSNPKAILVFESEREGAFKKEFIIDKLTGVKQPLVMFIEKNNGVILTENNLLDI